MPFTIGSPIRYLKSTKLGGAERRKITKDDLLEALYSQAKVKVFDDIHSAKLYANSLRKTHYIFKTTAEQSMVAPVYTIETTNDLLLSAKQKKLIERDDGTICLEYFEADKEIITKVVKAEIDYGNSKIFVLNWEKDMHIHSSNKSLSL